MPNLEPWQWVFAIIGSILVGISKTGIAGVGIFSVVVFANTFPARSSTGLILPLLVVADIVAAVSYRQHAQWKYLLRLFPWVGVGIGVGYGAMFYLTTDRAVGRLIGGIVVAMVGLHLWRERGGNGFADSKPTTVIENHSPTFDFQSPVSSHHLHHPISFAVIGLLCGFTSMVANAAGPIMILYMLAVGLPKMEFMGTAAWYFFLINVCKLPFSWHLNLITPDSLWINLWLAPLVVLGALAGRVIFRRINQKWFTRIALSCTLIAGIRLLSL